MGGGELIPHGESGASDSGQSPEESHIDDGAGAAEEPQEPAQEAPEEPEGQESVGSGPEAAPEVDYAECVDTDGGDDKYTFGTISRVTHYTDGTSEEEELFSDECVGNNIVKEYVCREGGQYRKTEWTCLRCENGACVE
ncbi:hypothetical protein JW721_05070 [Candidatus Micrarchaeota archaeon]|nr:hypothetical protein [Candidatus Micrarchaeota archaeon]